jgi:hypothetical protein
MLIRGTVWIATQPVTSHTKSYGVNRSEVARPSVQVANMSWCSTTDAKPGNQGSQLVTITRLVAVHPLHSLVQLVQPYHVHHSNEQSFYDNQSRNSMLQHLILHIRCNSNWDALLLPQDLSPREPPHPHRKTPWSPSITGTRLRPCTASLDHHRLWFQNSH